jgi:hypothetical protein
MSRSREVAGTLLVPTSSRGVRAYVCREIETEIRDAPAASIVFKQSLAGELVYSRDDCAEGVGLAVIALGFVIEGRAARIGDETIAGC